MMNFNAKMKSSFFDKISQSLSCEPIIQVLSEDSNSRQPPKLVGEFFCKDLNSKTVMRGIFSLHKDLLNYHGKELESNPIKILSLSYSRLFIDLQKTSVQIQKDQFSFELVYFEKKTFDTWMTEFQKFCILTDFDLKYEIVKTQEKSKSSNICLIESKMGGKPYTAKVFNKDQWSRSQNFFEKTSLINEIETLRAMNYHRILKLHEVYETENQIYLVMEFLQYQTLEKLFKKPKWQKTYLTQSRTKSIIFSLLKTLAYIASQGIVHRNIKPANIIIEEGSKNIKIINFSLATFLDSPKVNFRTCGTPGYIAPEIFTHDETDEDNKVCDSRCDVFSAGCIFFQMLFGDPLFSGSGLSDIFTLNKKGVSKEVLRTIGSEINNTKSCKDKQALNLLLRLLENNPKERITAADALSHPYFEAYHSFLKPEDHLILQNIIEKSHLEKLLSLSPRTSRKSSDAGSLRSDISPDRITLTQKHVISTDYFQPETSCGSSPLSKPCTSLLISHNKCLNEESQCSTSLRKDLSSSTLKVATICSARKPFLLKEKSVLSSLSRRNNTPPGTHFTRKNCNDIDDEDWDDIFDEMLNINTNYTITKKNPLFNKHS